MRGQKMKKLFTAVYMPDSKLTRQGFKTKKEAEKYITSRNCNMCVDDGMGSSCAAEWLIVSDSDYEKSENLGDLFDAAGFKRIT
jgi:hypothetical protein